MRGLAARTAPAETKRRPAASRAVLSTLCANDFGYELPDGSVAPPRLGRECVEPLPPKPGFDYATPSEGLWQLPQLSSDAVERGSFGLGKGKERRVTDGRPPVGLAGESLDALAACIGLGAHTLKGDLNAGGSQGTKEPLTILGVPIKSSEEILVRKFVKAGLSRRERDAARSRLLENAGIVSSSLRELLEQPSSRFLNHGLQAGLEDLPVPHPQVPANVEDLNPEKEIKSRSAQEVMLGKCMAFRLDDELHPRSLFSIAPDSRLRAPAVTIAGSGMYSSDADLAELKPRSISPVHLGFVDTALLASAENEPDRQLGLESEIMPIAAKRMDPAVLSQLINFLSHARAAGRRPRPAQEAFLRPDGGAVRDPTKLIIRGDEAGSAAGRPCRSITTAEHHIDETDLQKVDDADEYASWGETPLEVCQNYFRKVLLHAYDQCLDKSMALGYERGATDQTVADLIGYDLGKNALTPLSLQMLLSNATIKRVATQHYAEDLSVEHPGVGARGLRLSLMQNAASPEHTRVLYHKLFAPIVNEAVGFVVQTTAKAGSPFILDRYLRQKFVEVVRIVREKLAQHSQDLERMTAARLAVSIIRGAVLKHRAQWISAWAAIFEARHTHFTAMLASREQPVAIEDHAPEAAENGVDQSLSAAAPSKPAWLQEFERTRTLAGRLRGLTHADEANMNGEERAARALLADLATKNPEEKTKADIRAEKEAERRVSQAEDYRKERDRLVEIVRLNDIFLRMALAAGDFDVVTMASRELLGVSPTFFVTDCAGGGPGEVNSGGLVATDPLYKASSQPAYILVNPDLTLQPYALVGRKKAVSAFATVPTRVRGERLTIQEALDRYKLRPLTTIHSDKPTPHLLSNQISPFTLQTYQDLPSTFHSPHWS